VKRSKQGGSDLAWTLASMLLVNFQGLIALPIVIRLAGEATYGAYVLLLIGLAQLYELATHGFSYPYFRNLVSATSATERRQLFEPQFTYYLLILGIYCVLIFVFFPRLSDIEGKTQLTPWLLIGLLIANLISRQVLYYFRNTLRFGPYNIAFGATPLIFLSLLGVIAAATRHLSLDTLLALQCIAMAGVSLPFAAMLLREIGMPRLRLPWPAVVAGVSAGLPLALGMAVDFTLSFSDRYLIGGFLSIADVGRYQPAYQFASVILIFPRWIITIMTPLISGMMDRGERAAAEHLVDGCVSLFLVLAVPFTVGMLMVGPSFLAVLTTPQVGQASRWVMVLVAAAMTFDGVLIFMNSIALATKRPSLTLGPFFLGAVVNVSLNVALLSIVPTITVPAITTLIGYAAAGVWALARLRPIWRLHFEMPNLLRAAGAAGAMGVLLWFMGYRPAIVAPVDWAFLLLSIGAAVIVYFAVLVVLGGFGRREMSRLASLAHRRT
jgi:O-antigen/teichoic acid export membrane protein